MTPGLVAGEAGPGALTAARLLLSCSRHGRIRGEAAFAMLPGTAPVPVCSGRAGRHRLNRPGDRSSAGRCRSSPWPACAAARRPGNTSGGAWPGAKPGARYAAASNAAAHATSTACCETSPDRDSEPRLVPAAPRFTGR